MSNKTFIPAFQCAVGDWKYYICMMKYGEVARQVEFAYEMAANQELGQLIQRGISKRTKEITDYLLNSEHRFLGAIVIAAWGGEPMYTQLAMDDPEGILSGIDREFGVLTFDGTQRYFALDGQHRLRAIKDATKKKPELGKEDICVLIVTHYNDPQGRVRTRRLFSNINRNAKQTGTAENIALDEDDAFAVITRRILEEHPFLSEDGRVRVILSVGEDGELKLASASVPKTDAKAVTTMTVLYDVVGRLAWDMPKEVFERARRPSDEVLDKAHEVIVRRINDLLNQCGAIGVTLEQAVSARDVRAPRDHEGDGHPFMRPVVQKAIARVAWNTVKSGQLSWKEFVDRLGGLNWKLSAAPWLAVYSTESGKMLASKDNTVLLDHLLEAHLAPQSLQQIKRARKEFREVRGANYPVSEEDLSVRIPTHPVEPVVSAVGEGLEPPPETSEDVAEDV
jgi:DNA sulfur modification protein DndB